MLAVVGRGPAGLLGGMWQTQPGQWSVWTDLGPALSVDPVVAESADGRLEVFAIGRDGFVGRRAQLDHTGRAGWSGWEQIGPPESGRPAVFQNGDGRLELFAAGPGAELGHAWQVDPLGRSGWSAWEELGPAISDPAVFQNADGRLEVFAAGPDGRLGHRWQIAPGGHSGWSDWEVLGPEITGRPAVFQSADGRLEVFAADSGGVLGSIWQVDVNGGTGWGPWGDLGQPIASEPAVFQNPDGRLEVFAAAADGRLGHLWQFEPGGATGWSEWEGFGPEIAGPPAVFQNPDGRLELFAAGPGGVLGHRWQLDSGGLLGWSDWEELGPRISGVSVSVCQAQGPAGNEPGPESRVQRPARNSTTRTMKADVCVIGAGPAGITVSRDLVRAGASVVLADSGRLHEDPAAQELNRGVADGPILKGYWRYLLDGRWRGVQGAAKGWGRGFCMPFQPVDFKHRPWITYSGWPVTTEELAPYEQRAAETFAFDPFEPPQSNGALARVSYHFPSDPLVFRSIFGELSGGPNFDAVLGATATKLWLRGDQIEHVRFAFSDGDELRVHADAVVLAAGAIENARMLLLHEDTLPVRSEATGRCFMEHPHVLAGGVEIPDASEWVSCMADVNNRDVVSLDVIALEGERQWNERLQNATVQLRPKEVVAPVSGPVDCFLYVRAEQAPNPDSRVVLGQREDRYGMPWPVLHWRLVGRDWNSIVRTTELVVDDFKQEHGAPGELYIQAEHPWPLTPAGPNETENATWGYHQLGTTRMSDDPATGVVDRDCKVHGMENLYVAGSSVFPTGGAANPTFMIVALAHRLADHLAEATT
ncbi:MAG: GMC oxidoreductase [Thermoleophilaceae bacterium]